MTNPTSPARVRYMVNAIEPAVAFYKEHLGFDIKPGATPNFAMLTRGALELILSTPYGPGSAAQPMADGRKAEPADGIVSSSMSRTSRRKWRGYARGICISAATSSAEPADPKS
jgi:hypothetical protein